MIIVNFNNYRVANIMWGIQNILCIYIIWIRIISM